MRPQCTLTVKHFNLMTANFYDFIRRSFDGFVFWRIDDFRGKKITSSDVALCVLCMQVLHGDLHIIHDDSQLFSTLHYSWCLSVYKSVLLLFNYVTYFNLLLVVIFSLGTSINYQLYLQFLTITVNVYLHLFNTAEPVCG